MNLTTLLLEEHSKSQALRISSAIGGSKKYLTELLSIATGEDQDLARRAAWVVSCCAESYPDRVRPFLGEMLRNLSRPNLHDGVTRNTMKVAAELGIPDRISGLAVEISFRILESPEESLAARVHAMTILEHFCHEIPELTDELQLIIEHHLPHEKRPGFQSKARRVLSSLEKMRKQN